MELQPGLNTESFAVFHCDGSGDEGSNAWPCRICSKGVAATSLQCSSCTKKVYKRCSWVHGHSAGSIHRHEVSGRDSSGGNGRSVRVDEL